MTVLPGPGRPRDEDISHRVIGATVALLVEQGYDRVTLEAVARRAEVSRTAIYARWPGLPDLLFDATMAARAQVSTSVSAEELDVPDTGSLRGDLLALVHQGNEIFDVLDAVGVLQGILADAIRHERLAERLRSELLEPDEARYRVIFERAVDRGELAPGRLPDPDLIPQILIGLAVQRRLLTRRGFDDAVAHAVVDLLLDGLR